MIVNFWPDMKNLGRQKNSWAATKTLGLPQKLLGYNSKLGGCLPNKNQNSKKMDKSCPSKRRQTSRPVHKL